MSMSNASIPAFEIGLSALGASTKPKPMPKRRGSIPRCQRAPLPRHVRVYPSGAERLRPGQERRGARLASVEPPRYEDNEKTIAELRTRIAKTVAFVKTLDAERIDTAADREITFPLGPNNKGHMRGADYLNHFALPNSIFTTTAYDILRHCGSRSASVTSSVPSRDENYVRHPETSGRGQSSCGLTEQRSIGSRRIRLESLQPSPLSCSIGLSRSTSPWSAAALAMIQPLAARLATISISSAWKEGRRPPPH